MEPRQPSNQNPPGNRGLERVKNLLSELLGHFGFDLNDILTEPLNNRANQERQEEGYDEARENDQNNLYAHIHRPFYGCGLPEIDERIGHIYPPVRPSFEGSIAGRTVSATKDVSCNHGITIVCTFEDVGEEWAYRVEHFTAV